MARRKKKKNATEEAVVEETTAVAVAEMEAETESSNNDYPHDDEQIEERAYVHERDDLDPEPIVIHDDEKEEGEQSDEKNVLDERKEKKTASFLITKRQLLKVMGVINPITSKSSVYSIESNIVFKASEKTLTLRATNNSIYISKHLEVFENEGDVEVGVNAKKLFTIVNNLPDGLVRFNIEGYKMHLASEDKTVQHTLICINPEDFPETPKRPKEKTFTTIPCETMKKLIDKTYKFVSKEQFKPPLRGVYFERIGETLSAVATDGKRLAYAEKVIGGKESEKFEFIADAEFLKLAYQAILSNYGGTLQVANVGEFLFIDVAGYEFACQIIEGVYPNYKQVIPDTFPKEASIHRDELADAIKYVSPMIADTNSKRLTLTFNGDKTLSVGALNQEIGESTQRIHTDYVGASMTFAFNYTFFADILTTLEGASVVLKMTESDEKPVMIADKEKGDYYFIVMPMHLDEEGETQSA